MIYIALPIIILRSQFSIFTAETGVIGNDQWIDTRKIKITEKLKVFIVARVVKYFNSL